MSPLTSTLTFNNGQVVPTISYGSTLYRQNGDIASLAPIVLSALKSGIRHLDTAQRYLQESDIGEAIKVWIAQHGGRREELFITGKCLGGGITCTEHPMESAKSSLNKLGIANFDSFLIHQPSECDARGGLQKAWSEMEEVLTAGMTKSIGLSNMTSHEVEMLSKTWKVAPVVDQVEHHPYLIHSKGQQELIETCNKHDIKIWAYAPLQSLTRSPGGPLDIVISRIARHRQMSESQVLISWAALSTGGGVVTTTSKTDRIGEIATMSGEEPARYSLTDDEMRKISEAGKGRYYRQYLRDGAWTEGSRVESI